MNEMKDTLKDQAVDTDTGSSQTKESEKREFVHPTLTKHGGLNELTGMPPGGIIFSP